MTEFISKKPSLNSFGKPKASRSFLLHVCSPGRSQSRQHRCFVHSPLAANTLYRVSSTFFSVQHVNTFLTTSAADNRHLNTSVSFSMETFNPKPPVGRLSLNKVAPFYNLTVLGSATLLSFAASFHILSRYSRIYRNVIVSVFW